MSFGKNDHYLIGRPNLGREDVFQRRMAEVYSSKWLTNNGPMVQELEQRLVEYLGVKHCVAMSNGTVALELAIRANGLCDEVIVPSMTFVATAHALQWQGITPVFADIDPLTKTLSLASVNENISPRTTGIVGVHLYGRPCEVENLQNLADFFDLKLLFDSAHAFGVSSGGRFIGNFGNCEVFSFHATKVFNTFEGGAVTTNDDELARKLRLMRNFGFEGEDEVSYIGTNGKMSEVCAAMGLTNLESLHEFIDVNRVNYHAYMAGLEALPGVELITYDEQEKNNFQYIILRVDEALYGRTRDELKQKLEDHGVMARRYFYPGCHRMEPYATLYPDSAGTLPHTEAFSQQVLALPTGTQLAPEDVGMICNIIREYRS